MSLSFGSLRLRPFRRFDRRAYVALREANRDWLDRWEARDPLWEADAGQPPSYSTLFRAIRAEHRSGRSPSLAVCDGRELIGHINFGSLQFGASSSASIGFWIDQRRAGEGLIPKAIALAVEDVFARGALHRIEALVRPGNHNSMRVMQKLQWRSEGLRKACIYVDGQWRHHEVFAITAEEVTHPGMLLDRALV